MKILTILTISVLIFINTSFAQKTMPIAAIHGIFDGKINIKDLRKCKGIEVLNNKKNYKVKSVVMSLSFKGYYLKELLSNTSKFNSKILGFINNDSIFSISPVIVHDIIAVNRKNDTIHLNPILLQVTKEKSEKNLIPKITEYPNIGGRFDQKIAKNWLAAQTGIAIKDSNYAIQKFQVDSYIWAGFYEPAICESNKFEPRAKQMIQQGNKTIIHNIQAIDKNGKIYRLPILYFIFK